MDDLDHSAEESLLEFDEEISTDDIEDLPEFVLPPDGLYVFALSQAKINTSKTKEGETKKRINHIYTISKVIQLADPKELSPALGSLVGENFTLNSEGLKIWKAKTKALLGEEKLKGLTVGEAVKVLGSEGSVFVGKTRIKKSTGKDGKQYENVQIQVIKDMNPDDDFMTGM